MTSLFPFEFLVGGSHHTKNKNPVNKPDAPIASNTGFIPANVNKSQIFVSFDNKELKINDIIYQISNIKDSYTPILREFVIKEFVSDGRVRISGETKINGIVNKLETIVSPREVCTNAEFLLKHWIINLKHKINVELPTIINGLEKILIEINPSWDKNLEVGEGLLEEEI